MASPILDTVTTPANPDTPASISNSEEVISLDISDPLDPFVRQTLGNDALDLDHSMGSNESLDISQFNSFNSPDLPVVTLDSPPDVNFGSSALSLSSTPLKRPLFPELTLSLRRKFQLEPSEFQLPSDYFDARIQLSSDLTQQKTVPLTQAMTPIDLSTLPPAVQKVILKYIENKSPAEQAKSLLNLHSISG